MDCLVEAEVVALFLIDFHISIVVANCYIIQAMGNANALDRREVWDFLGEVIVSADAHGDGEQQCDRF